MSDRKVSDYDLQTAAQADVTADYAMVVHPAASAAADRNKRMTLTEIAKAVVQYASSFLQSGSVQTRTVSGKLQECVSVLDHIPETLHASIKARTNTTDLSSYIALADAACCAGTLGLDGATVLAEKALYFPAGAYKHSSTLTYRGAPWFGDGVNATRLDYYGSTYAVDATGTNTNRKLLSISKMALNGSNAGAGARGLKLGYNQRSLGATRQVRIENFTYDGMYFAADSWQMSFEDTYIRACGTTSGAGIGLDAAATTLADFDWYKLQLESCGQAASSTGGAFHFNNAGLAKWTFHGLLLQGNLGAAEAEILAGDSVGIAGLWIESDLAAAGAVDGLIIGGSVNASISLGSKLTAVAAHAGKALRVIGTSTVSVDNPFVHANWPTQISVEGTAVLHVLSNGNLDFTKVTAAAGATVYRTASGTWSPSRTGFTEVLGGGTITCTGTYRRSGNSVAVTARIICAGGATIAAATGAGSSLGNLPYTVGGSYAVGGWVNSVSIAEGGMVLANTTSLYVATAGWAAAANRIYEFTCTYPLDAGTV